MKIKPILYQELVYTVYKSLLNEETIFPIIKQNNKYILAKFNKNKIKQYIKTMIQDILQGHSRKLGYREYIIIIDTCKASQNELCELYLSRLSDKKRAIITEQTDIKYFLRDRTVRIPEEAIAKIFDEIFNYYFRKSEYSNIYFVRATNLPAYEVYNQLKEEFGNIITDIEYSDEIKHIKDINWFIWHRLKNVKYTKSKELTQYIKKIFFKQ
jgi:hypothetical protein